LNVLTYGENFYAEETYRKVEDIPSAPLAAETPIMCMLSIDLFLISSIVSRD
jgi:hypothetical protein